MIEEEDLSPIEKEIEEYLTMLELEYWEAEDGDSEIHAS